MCTVQFWYFYLLSIFHSVCPSQVMDLCWTSINVTAKTAFIIQAELQSMALKVSTMIKCYGSINGLNKNMWFQKILITFHVVDVFFSHGQNKKCVIVHMLSLHIGLFVKYTVGCRIILIKNASILHFCNLIHVFNCKY